LLIACLGVDLGDDVLGEPLEAGHLVRQWLHVVPLHVGVAEAGHDVRHAHVREALAPVNGARILTDGVNLEGRAGLPCFDAEGVQLPEH
jgi:hypothetical protein